MAITCKIRHVGTTIFTVMSKPAHACGAISLCKRHIFEACGLHPRKSKV